MTSFKILSWVSWLLQGKLQANIPWFCRVSQYKFEAKRSVPELWEDIQEDRQTEINLLWSVFICELYASLTAGPTWLKWNPWLGNVSSCVWFSVADFEYSLNRAVMTTVDDFPFIFGPEVMYIVEHVDVNYKVGRWLLSNLLFFYV